jgi:hypothetical protein
LELFIETYDQMATDPRDKLFAFYSLNICPIQPDYDKNTRQVYCEAAAAWVTTGAKTTCLVLSGLYHETHSGPLALGLPSWVPNWQGLTAESAVKSKQFGESFSGFRASKGMPSETMGVDDDFALHDAGVSFGTVEWLGPMATERQQAGVARFRTYMRSVVTEMTDILEKFPQEVPPMQLIMRTITLDKTIRGNQVVAGTEEFYKDLARVEDLGRAFLDTLSRDPEETQSASTMATIEKLCQRWGFRPGAETLANFARSQLFWGHNVPQATEPKSIADWEYPQVSPMNSVAMLTNASRGLFYGRVFRTSDGRMGVGPSQMKIQDRVYVLCGCDFPALLREVKDGADGSYQYVGPCFVFGLMTGETEAMVAAEEAELELLALV